MIILKVTKNQGVTLFLKNTLSGKLPEGGEGGVKLTPTLFRVNQKHIFISVVYDFMISLYDFV